MSDFIDALKDPAFPFLRYSLMVGLLASVSLGIVGSYVVARRITYIAAAISHCILGGIGAALYLNVAVKIGWCSPVGGALVAAILSAIIIGLLSLHAKQREDTVISAVWAIGMAVGVILFEMTPGYVDPMSYLFGDITLASADDLKLVLVLDVVVAAVGIGFYPKLLALCFDEEIAELRGVRVKFYYLLLLCMTALTVVLLVRVVGIVLVIALLTLPAAVAGHFSRQLWQMMLAAAVCSMIFTTTGIAVSFHWALPSGPVIVLIAGAAYLVVALFSRLLRRMLNA
jgi:zinc transport system permease protein